MGVEKNLKVLIDCDPGADDVFALLWLLINHKHSKIPMEIVGITTVGGNVSADATYQNALRMAQFVWATEIPVGKDHHKITAEDAAHIHGSDGIGNLSKMLPPVQLPEKELDSVEMIIEAIEKYGDELAILATWPLTNLAIAEERSPGILEKAKKIIAMGGAVNAQGNVTAVAEFNISYDPESAAKVFAATDNMMLLPLDLTTSLAFTEDNMYSAFKEFKNTAKQNFLVELTKFIIGTNMEYRETAYKKWFFIHDAHTVGLLLYPHLYKWAFMQVYVETQGEYTKWQTVSCW